jgi:hypothetical protein
VRLAEAADLPAIDVYIPIPGNSWAETVAYAAGSKPCFCPHWTRDEAVKDAQARLKPTKFVWLPEYVPPPRKSPEEEREERSDPRCAAEYWETDMGKHGWCCPVCGQVTQWG